MVSPHGEIQIIVDPRQVYAMLINSMVGALRSEGGEIGERTSLGSRNAVRW